MKQRDKRQVLSRNPLVLSVAGLLIAGLFGSGVWLFQRKMAKSLSGYSNSSLINTATKPKITTSVILLGDTFSGYSTFRNDFFQAALGNFGIGLTYIDEFDQGSRAARMTEGEADLLVTTLDQYLIHQPVGQIVGIIDRTIGADAVVLNSQKYPELKSLKDLQSLTQKAKSKGEPLGIAFAGGTPSEYLATILDIKFEDFNMADFEQIRVADASEAWDLMRDPSRNVAIAVLWEPYVTKAIKDDYQVVLSSNDAPYSIIDVIVASDGLIQTKAEELSELLEAYYQRLDTNIPNPTELNEQISQDGELTTQEANDVMRGIYFFSAAEAEKWMREGILKQRIEAISKILLQAGQIKAIPENPENLFTAKFIHRASLNTHILIDQLQANNSDLSKRLEGSEILTASVAEPNKKELKDSGEIGDLEVRGNIEFALESVNLTEIGEQTLDNLASQIQEFNPLTVGVVVIGHASKTGDAAFNQSISQQRAQVVVDYLVSAGVENTITAIGKGFNEPLPNMDPRDGRNQRTQIRLVRIGPV
ncbi:MAG: phosphate ABC transporter substrate-binding/OmpA family protein [Leptolyngbyaceae cyanobacterium MO_188.B28]|nr:phosphate ABC transporter substrate-binding/OmpA family protein [Leptolyngbyaceae cyanobacterium MO_188.B28]